jgi:enediyne biosynthesis protein E4
MAKSALWALCLICPCWPADAPSIRFRDVAESAGVHFVLENSPTPQKHMIETMAGGVAAFDFDGDGRTDLFFTNGAALPSLQKDSPKYFNRLYRNEGGWKFRDVTEAAGVAGAGYAVAAAAGDYNNDGHVDLFVAGFRHNILYRNRGDGTFEDVTAKSGISSNEWVVAAGWFDYDNDGLLDLFVVNYADWSLEFNRFCGDSDRNIRVYCHPRYLTPIANRLYRNRGDGTFEDVSVKSGIAAFKGRGMGLAFGDYDGDGKMDVFVTNDKLPNFLFHNLGNGKFEEVALEAGVALPDHGKAVSSMGADFRDYDNDGLPDIATTALHGETFPLFRNQGKGSFEEVTSASRLARTSTLHTGWSVGLIDFNNDGWKDLFSSNADVNDLVAMFEPVVYKQANTVFENTRDGKFSESPIEFGQLQAHRGSAFADFDGDGKIDIVIASLEGPAELWRNESGNSNHWLILKLTGTKSNRDGIGAEVRIGSQVNSVSSAVGYASSSLFGVHFGLGGLAVVPRVEIRWPSGLRQVLENVQADQVLRVVEPR